MWALDTLSMGDGLLDTNRRRELGTGSCLRALEIQAKERRSDFGHRTGAGRWVDWGHFLWSDFPRGEGKHLSVIFFTCLGVA